MENILEVKNLCKEYPAFKLDNVSFEIKKGSIMGFIGRNGAGKTTTLKCLLNFVHPKSGEINFFGLNFMENESEIKQNIGYAAGGVNFYSRKKLSDILNINKRFYTNWDDTACNRYMKLFKLVESKKLIELSDGMKVKFNLVLALSHNAKIVLLDEPTSGLDPISREDLLDVFLDLASVGVSILFSTHITSDLDKCAEYLTYIQQGKILASMKTNDFIAGYKLVIVPLDSLNDDLKKEFIGINRTKDNFTGLIKTENAKNYEQYKIVCPSLEQIMTHIDKEKIQWNSYFIKSLS